MKSRPPPPTPSTPAERFRLMIEGAVASGADMSRQVLQLTHGDNAKLRKDPAVGDEEIRFDHGVMSFLGVRVIVGSPVSELSAADEVIVLSDRVGGKASEPGDKKAASKARKGKADKLRPAA